MRTHSLKKLIMATALVATIAALPACANSRSMNEGLKSEINDPLEPLNRGIFAFNNAIDVVVLEPVARAYRFFVPDFARTGVKNFMRNLRTPVFAANNVLQGDFNGAGRALGRFALNTTAGIGGLIDVASDFGMPYEPEDFGQTLAVWGVGHGPYLVLPIFGASSVRDGIGMVPDALADPVRIAYLNTDQEYLIYVRAGVEAIDNRSRLIDTVDDLKRNSLDYYASVRSIYGQRRAALVRDEAPEAALYSAYDDAWNEE